MIKTTRRKEGHLYLKEYHSEGEPDFFKEIVKRIHLNNYSYLGQE